MWCHFSSGVAGYKGVWCQYFSGTPSIELEYNVVQQEVHTIDNSFPPVYSYCQEFSGE